MARRGVLTPLRGELWEPSCAATQHDSREALCHFVRVVSAPPARVRRFVVHARKAILGLNTVQNRSVPPLRRDWVYKLISDFPSLTFTINGAVGSLEEAHELLERGAHGVMIGRKANSDPYNLFSRCGVLYNGEAGPSRREVLDAYLLYCGKAEGANWEETTIEGCARSLTTRSRALAEQQRASPPRQRSTAPAPRPRLSC